MILFIPTALWHRHTQTVGDGASSHKQDNMSEILNHKEHQNRFIGLKVTSICWMGEFCLLVEWHREGSAPAACVAGLFTYTSTILALVEPNKIILAILIDQSQ